MAKNCVTKSTVHYWKIQNLEPQRRVHQEAMWALPLPQIAWFPFTFFKFSFEFLLMFLHGRLLHGLFFLFLLFIFFFLLFFCFLLIFLLPDFVFTTWNNALYLQTSNVDKCILLIIDNNSALIKKFRGNMYYSYDISFKVVIFSI